jgi:SAM-dependent methyltransferase
LKWALQLIGKVFIEIEIKQGYRKDLPRPDATPKENKIKFMDKLTNWKTIWNNKPENETLSLKTLLSLDGFENVGEISIDAWLDYVKHIQEKLNITKEETILEVGCGAGAFLYPLYSQGFNVSGCDYSKSLIANANKAIKSSFVCCNINNYISDVKFNHVISNSVFQYFPDYTYAEKVIQKLITLSKSTISILDVNDLKKVLDATKERPVYPAHTFYSKDWWIELAQKYNLDILIEDQAIENYSNSKFRYNVFLRKV